MKQIIALITFFILILSCSRKTDQFEILASIDGFNDSTIIYLNDLEKDEIIDSTFVINNKFQFSGTVKEPTRMIIQNNDYKNFKYKFIWIGNSIITINGNADDFKNAKVEGSKTENESVQLYSQINPIRAKKDSLITLKRNMYKENKLEGIENIDKKVDKLDNEIKNIKISFFRNNPDSYVTIFNLSFACLTGELNKNEMKEIFEDLPTEMRNTIFGERISEYLKLSEPPEIGEKYIDFAQNDLSGNQVSLSDYDGKYTLVEFWASGCGPCRWDNPKLVQIYKKFNPEGFEILGVSLDNNKDKWINAVKKDSLLWINISDLKGSYNEAALIYGVRGIPANFLIDTNGIIIYKDLRGPKLEETLKEIFADI